MAKRRDPEALLKSQIQSCMRSYVDEYRDAKTGEVNATALAEVAAQAFNLDYLDGPLDDTNHWIWEVALRIAEESQAA